MPINDNSKLKNITVAVFLIFLMLAVVYSVFFGPVKHFTDSMVPTRTFSVSAEGKVTVSPDIANLSFSVISEGSNPKTIANENVQKMNAAINFAKSQGIEEKDIKTSQYSLNPRYEYDEDKKTSFISGYTLTQTVLVKIRNLDKVADVVAGLPGLGINQIGSISFDIDDPEVYLADARNQAFEKAAKKAEEMASQNNIKIDKIISFSDWNSSPRFYEQSAKTALGMGGVDSSVPVPQIEPGSQEVTVQVSITYGIK
ncbi:SIMPL domain-containing protein [Candidatus Wolfebacteria bacterium]|nr:SIMPL domain-containing protein [Candidatus Wolfebacteria bacterium]